MAGNAKRSSEHLERLADLVTFFETDVQVAVIAMIAAASLCVGACARCTAPHPFLLYLL